MFYFMTLSFIIMPALGCFLIGLAFAKSDRWDFSWSISLIGLAAFISSFWHIARVDLWFMLSYSVWRIMRNPKILISLPSGIRLQVKF